MLKVEHDLNELSNPHDLGKLSVFMNGKLHYISNIYKDENGVLVYCDGIDFLVDLLQNVYNLGLATGHDDCYKACKELKENEV